jgi:ribose transport system substrate-binding protein
MKALRRPWQAGWVTYITLAAIAMTACGGGNTPSSSSSSAQHYTFAYANVFDKSPTFKSVADNLVSQGKQVDITVRRYDNNSDGPTVLSNAKLMVQERPDVAIDWMGAEGVGPAVGKLFGDAKIPCIAVNQTIPGCPFFNLVNKDFGVQGAEIVAPLVQKAGWTAADTTLILAAAPGAGAEVNSNSRFFYEDLANKVGLDKFTADQITDSTTTLGRNLVQVNGQGTGNGPLEGTYTAVKTVLQSIPASRHLIVFTINDDSGLGGWRAITESHRENNTMILSAGADADGISQLRTNPHWVAEFSVFFEFWSEYLLAMGVAVKKGIKTPPQTYSPQVVLSKDNVDQYYNGTTPKAVPPLPEQDKYLIQTGVLQKFGNIPGVH